MGSMRTSAFIDDRAKAAAEKPFFLYLALPAPHTPWMPTKKYLGKSKETICLTDMLATFAAVTDQKLPNSDGLDSYNITPLLLGRDHKSPFREATIHQSGRRVLAVRSGKWKLIPTLGLGGCAAARLRRFWRA
jgi:arylsulfatase A-like enzyme